MRTLTMEEMDFVSGGLTDKPKEEEQNSLWDRFVNWISSWFEGSTSSGGSSSGLPQLSGSDLGQMQRDCLDHGGDFSISATSGSAGASFELVDANGNVSYAEIHCDR